jgi:hypothetical protein
MVALIDGTNYLFSMPYSCLRFVKELVRESDNSRPDISCIYSSQTEKLVIDNGSAVNLKTVVIIVYNRALSLS